ncbi:hypothetical protein [Palleronia caenipelagi]|uniref:Uncharacterized protein n=1 Tax=Palleronia caenipelagi TaxID=2489174 RepID=A0A547Q7U2_9RHOB|nr:hypothetical protein [Palleronia caenipelagi]TRD22452.1 hypothetical protein FEV53_05185 [Palleronia caenipelagi]
MSATDKALTLSYGIFTCRLVGFADPFSIMQWIVECVRDAEADARERGLSQVVLPDELLCKVASRASGGPVTAQQEDGIVMLSPAKPEDIPAAAAPEIEQDEDPENDTDDLVEVEMLDENDEVVTVRLTPEEFEAAVARGEIEELSPEEAAAEEFEDEIRKLIEPTSLSEDQHEILIAELVEIELEHRLEDLDAPGIAGGDDNPSAGTGEMDAAAMERLIEGTSERMQSAELTRSRETLQHLKKAYAEGSIENEDARLDPSAEFRSDLEAVVAQAEETLGVLVLPSDARVDSPSDPHRGRQSFTSFAEERGATALPDLIEAATAYVTILEHRDTATRDEIVSHAREVQTDLSDENGSEAIAALVAQGRLTDAGDDHFVLA